LRRISGLPTSKSLRELTRIASLGFQVKLRNRKHDRDDPTIELSFQVRRVAYDGPDDATATIDEMIQCLGDEYCPDCIREAVAKGDFSGLATVTRRPEQHS